MLDWTPYLNEIFGEDAAHTTERQTPGEKLLAIASALVDKPPQADDRVRLLDWIGELDDVQQVFLLPELGRQLADSSVVVRRRLFTLLNDIQGEESGVDELLEDVAKLLDAPAPTVGKLLAVLSAIEKRLLDERELDLAMPLATLQFLRRPAFGLSVLAGLCHALSTTAARQSLMQAVKNFFTDDQRAPLCELLRYWLVDGPLFLRYLMVRFIDDTGQSLSKQQTPAQALLEVYRTDRDPLVASAAIESYAHHVEPKDLLTAIDLLYEEFASFARRPLEFKWEFNSPDVGDRVCIRMLGAGLLRALGHLGLHHLNNNQQPLNTLCKILTTPPSNYLALNLSSGKLSAQQSERIFHAAMLLHGRNIRVRVIVLGHHRRIMYANAGISQMIEIVDPDRLLPEHPEQENFWAEAYPVYDAKPPEQWIFKLHSVAGDDPATEDLVGLMSPALSPLIVDDSNDFKNLQEQAHTQIDARGWWMQALIKPVTAIIEQALEQELSLDQEPFHTLFGYLKNMGLGMAHSDHPTRRGMIRSDVINSVRQQFLNRLTSPKIFDALFPEGEVGLLEAQLLTVLADSALRSLPGATERRWLDGNVDALREIAASPMHVKIRASAALALAYGADRLQSVQRTLNDLLLPSVDNVFTHIPWALRFTPSNELDPFCIKRTSQKNAFRFAAGEDDKKERRIIFLFCEVLVRALASGEQNSERADLAAAACLGTQSGLYPFARRRLIQGYAANPTPLPPNNITRLLGYLLRTSTSAELALFFSGEESIDRLLENNDIFRQLVNILVYDRTTRRSAAQHFDHTAVMDRLARHRIVLRLLARQARSHKADFFRRYREFRDTQLGLMETPTAIAASGQVLRTQGRDGESLELLAVLQPARGDDTALADRAGNIFTAFVHHPRPEAKLNCLAHFHPMPDGAIDLHSVISEECKPKLLEDRLASGKALVLARVIRCEQYGRYFVDIGTAIEGLEQIQHVWASKKLKIDDALLVEITQHTWPSQSYLVNGRFRLSDPDGALPIHDLRRVESPIATLQSLNAEVAHQPYRLRATVKKVKPHSDGALFHCTLDTGFQLFIKGKLILPAVDLEERPKPGQEIIVEPRYLQFENKEHKEFRIKPSWRNNLVDQAVVLGTLHSTHDKADAPRRWWGLIGKLELPLPRQRLTGDLGTLFALDALADDHPILERLGTQALPLRVIDEGEHCSVIDAPPQWLSHDLTLAVISDEVDTLTFLGFSKRTKAPLFEVHRRGDEESGARRLSGFPIGTLATLFEGELFNSNGDPLRFDSLGQGARLLLQVTFDRINADGTLPAVREAKGLGWDASPHLRIIGRPHETNAQYYAMFETNRPLQVRIVSQDPEPVLALAETIPGGYRVPDLTYHDRRYFSGRIGKTLEVVVRQAGDPTAERFAVEVAPPGTHDVHLSGSGLSQANEIRRLFEWRTGTFWSDEGSKKRLSYHQKYWECIVRRGLKIELDPLTQFLLTHDVDAKDFQFAVEDVDILVTGFETRYRRPLPDFSRSYLPALDKHGQAIGVVTGIPHGSAQARRVKGRWMVNAPEPGHPATMDFSFDPGEEKYYNGDLIQARRTAEGIAVWHQHRSLQGTLIHAVRSFDEWASDLKEKLILATYIRGLVDGDARYLFVLGTASLVAVPAYALNGAEHLDDAWPLDRLELHLTFSDTKEPKLDIVQTVAPGLLHLATNKPCILAITWYDYSTHNCICRLYTSTDEGDVELAVQIPLSSLPRSKQEEIRKASPNTKNPFNLHCVFDSYDLNVEPIISDGKRESVRLGLEPRFAEQVAPEWHRKPSLQRVLALKEGRIDDASGRVVQRDGEPSLGVELDAYSHTRSLPLPDKEQTWIAHTDHYVQPGWKGRFTVICGEDGIPFASLRRRRPLSLANWIERSRFGYDDRFIYFGLLSDAERANCGLDIAASGEPEVLFEVEAGLAFTAPQDHLRFFGEPFDLHTLQCGDRVTRARVFAIDDEGDQGLDIQNVIPDLRHEIEHFARESGVFYGSIQPNTLEIAELFGLHGNKQLISEHRGRWKFSLEPLDKDQREWTNSITEDEYCYFEFIDADEATGQLRFRLMRPAEALIQGKLVYVKAVGIEHYGEESVKLVVRPLNRLEGQSCHYFIPDTLYSERLGWLKTTSRSQSGIFLANVNKCESSHRGLYVRLSLIHIPLRKFWLLFSCSQRQAIIKKKEHDTLYVELSEGVNVEVPCRRIDWLSPEWQDVQPGDVIFFAPQTETSRISVTAVRRSHLAYLHSGAPSTLLTLLWSRPDKRWRKLKEGGLDTKLNCSVVGLPLLKGLCRPIDAHVGSTRALPQIVNFYNDDWVYLDDRQDRSVMVGLLATDDSMRAKINPETGAAVPLLWSEVTFREAPFGELASLMTALTFRNYASIEANFAEDALATTPVVALLNDSGQPSLTALAHWPFPVEHLAEQFPPRKALRAMASPHVRTFTVARAEQERLTLEIAPGRFAELPVALVMPRHQPNLRAGLRMNLGQFRPGDSITLEMVVPKDGGDEFIPRFRIHSVSFGQGRHLESTFTIPRLRDNHGTPCVGIKDGALFALPALDTLELADDHIIDLRQIDRKEQRYFALRDGFKRYGDRLVLVGEVDRPLHTDQSVPCLVNIGISVPFRRGNHISRGDPLISSRHAIPLGTRCLVRVRKATFDGTLLSEFEYHSELSSKSEFSIIQGGPDGLRQSHHLPSEGDAVLVYQAQDETYRVAGFPEFEIIWIPDREDVLELSDLEHKRIILKQLINNSEAYLWSTVKIVDSVYKTILLSRRTQIERSLPKIGEVIMARVIGALSNSSLLIDLGGLPWILNRNELCYGEPSLKELCTYEEKYGGLLGALIEVVRKSDGNLSARAVYADLPKFGELEATIVNHMKNGLMVIAKGQRMFVPKRELAWCDLDREQISQLFPQGEKILVTPPHNEVPDFSHIRTHAIRMEFAKLMRERDEPVYVRCVLMDEGKGRIIVRGRSKALMTLIQTGCDNYLDERICAYVNRIEDTRQRLVELSTDKIPERHWYLPQIPDSASNTTASFAVDRLSEQVILASLEKLELAIEKNGLVAVTDWAAQQPHIEPSPRNLRLTIERLHQHFGNSTAWAEPRGLIVDTANEIQQSLFYETWLQVADLLAGRVARAEVKPAAQFAVGYFHLLAGQTANAQDCLNAAWADPVFMNNFDVGLSRACALFLTGDASTASLHDLTMRFFAAALCSLIPPLLAPEAHEFTPSDREQFNEALRTGDINALERLLLLKYGKQRNPKSARTCSNVIWFLLVKGHFGPEFPEFDDAVDEFFDALRDESSSEMPIDPRLNSMAALLSFGRGNSITGWWYLDKTRQGQYVNLYEASFWRAWMSDEKLPDGLLAKLWRIAQQCEWRREVDPQSFKALWDEFRLTPVRWVLGSARCRAVSKPPDSYEDLKQWAAENGAKDALRPLLAEIGFDESVLESN